MITPEQSRAWYAARGQVLGEDPDDEPDDLDDYDDTDRDAYDDR